MSKRTRTIGLITICVACLGALVFLGFRGNVIYYYEVTEAVAKADSQQADRFRLAGAVVNGSIESNGSTTTFQVTDGAETVNVVHRGDPPELFKDGAPVVCEGRWSKDALGEKFDSDLIMIKHGNEYVPPQVDQETQDTQLTGEGTQ
jgi:cytochrome c-type biogenesis protein CcmE